MAMNEKLVSKIAISALAAAMLTMTGCSKNDEETTPSPSTSACDSSVINETLPSSIDADTTLDASKVYGLSGKVNVKNNAKLTIPAGTTIAGCSASSFMVIEPGSQLIAKGTQAKPIVFTSQKDVLGDSNANAAGEWGGLVLAGNAYTHYENNTYEADESVSFGSSDHTHDGESSGDLEYVVIKHSGYEVEKDKELNGLSLAGVGSGTILKNIAIIGGLDDGIEIWGGRADIDGLFIYNAHDDSVDTDLGYRGTIKNVLVQQINVDKTNNHDSSGMEFGNDHNTIVTDDSNATQPTIINYTGYIKGGGYYNKFDAGFKWDNVKFISAKDTDEQLVHFRGTDSYDTGAKHLLGDVCFKDTALTLTEDNSYSKSNSKAPKTEKTAYDYFVADHKIDLGGNVIYIDDSGSCAGADETTIWKGKAGSNDPLETPAAALSSTITTDMTLTADKVWSISGKVNVKAPAKLTIEPGTTLAGATPSSYLVIEPGAQIIANGTMAKPIVFTSQKDVDNASHDNAAGEWGGLVLAGNAYTHYSNNKYEADETVTFGSTDHTHDGESSGTLNYVVVKHTGFEVEKDKELNGLSLAGVGSGTTLTNIAIIGGLDDGIEIWGGTANITGLYIYNAHDDSVDTDLGYRGTIKNVVVTQVNVDKTNNHDSSGMEFGNDHNTIVTDDTNATQPTIINYTGYIKGGGFYNKFDAGFKWENITFVSDKTADTEMIHFRGTDSYTTGAKHVNGAVCFKDNAETLTDALTYSNANSKPDTNPAGQNTAFDYFVTNKATTLPGMTGSLNIDDTSACDDSFKTSVWKGKAGSNDPLETPVP